MKILHWDEMFHPTFGYQINILPKYQAQNGHEVIIMTSDEIEKHPAFASFAQSVDIEKEDKVYSKKYGVQIIRLPIHRVVSGRVIYKRGYLKKIKELQPDIIMCHTNDTLSSIRIAKNYKYLGIPLVFDNHMLEMASRNPISKIFRKYFKHFVTPLIIKNKWKVIRTQDDDYVNKHLGIPKILTPFISFGSDTTLFYPDNQKKQTIREEYGIKKDDFVVIYTGKLSEVKGGMLLAKTFVKKFDVNRDVVLLVIGNTIGEYEKRVKELLNSSENTILFFSTQRYIDLPKFYQMADVSVFPKQCSLSFYDAQACGLPVIAENNNINIDRLSHKNGLVYEANSIDDFRLKIKNIAEMKAQEYEQISSNAFSFVKKDYDYKNITEQYTKVLIEEYERFHNME